MARHDYLTNLSYFWYDFANKKVGYEEMIRNRREVDKFLEEVNNVQLEGLIVNKLISGSRAEGFRFKTSDLDLMLVYKTIKVKLENDVTHDQIDDNTVLIMETDKTRPGFCMLRLDSCSHREYVCDLCALYRNSKYLSSALWRNEKKKSEEMWIHGPCVSMKNGNLEIDYAYCLQCTKWPRQALSCILRMVKAGWPSIDILTGIVQNGCHLVPIGDKVSDKEVLEWRISFSVAEKTLIHQMNHCQFLCYGMLKIFLKEVIDKTSETNGLICSYFLKTAVLWEIVHNTKLWEMKDFLKWVWICFRRLLSWVKEGYCPNFFIPENNMFLGKIYGRSQRVLLHHLTILYMEGYRCLPVCRCNRCLSIYRLSHFIQFPVSEFVCKKWEADFDIMDEIFTSWSCKYNKPRTCSLDFVRDISFLQHMQREQDQTYVRKVITNVNLHDLIRTFLFKSVLKMIPNFFVGGNKRLYGVVSNFLSTLKRTKIDVVTHKFLSAIFLYRCGMYRHVLRIVINIKKHLQKHNVMYEWTLHADKYKEAGGEFLPVDVMIKKFIVLPDRLKAQICLPELDMKHVKYCSSVYPPMVLLYFLSYMSHYRLEMYSEADSVLNDLNVLVNYDDGRQVPRLHKGISWLVLGTCQEIGGYRHDALTSYNTVLEVEANYSFILETALERIENLQLL